MSTLRAYIYEQAKKQEQEKREASRPKHSQHFSHLFGEGYTIEPSGRVVFESTSYTKEELDKMRGLSNEAKKKVHTIKKLYEGMLLCAPYQS